MQGQRRRMVNADAVAANVDPRSVRLERFVTSWFIHPRLSHSIGYLATLMVSVGLVLHLLGATLYISNAWGIEDWLGWGDENAVNAMTLAWHVSQRWAALLYLAIDSALFVPLYTALFLTLAVA